MKAVSIGDRVKMKARAHEYAHVQGHHYVAVTMKGKYIWTVEVWGGSSLQHVYIRDIYGAAPL